MDVHCGGLRKTQRHRQTLPPPHEAVFFTFQAIHGITRRSTAWHAIAHQDGAEPGAGIGEGQANVQSCNLGPTYRFGNESRAPFERSGLCIHGGLGGKSQAGCPPHHSPSMVIFCSSSLRRFDLLDLLPTHLWPHNTRARSVRCPTRTHLHSCAPRRAVPSRLCPAL